MQIARLLRYSSKVMLLTPSISLLIISFLIGTGETKISSANLSAAGEFSDSRLPCDISHLNVIQRSSQASKILVRIESEDYKVSKEEVDYHNVSSCNSGGEYHRDLGVSCPSDIDSGHKTIPTVSAEQLTSNVLVGGIWKYNITDGVTSGEDVLKSPRTAGNRENATGVTSVANASSYDSFVNITVLPLGDSITSGNGKHITYRYPLWVKFIDSGFNFDGIHFDLVGSQNSKHNGNRVWPEHRGHSFDHDHEGHPGWRAEQILAILPTWLKGYTPDIVLLHIGTNDVMANQSTLSTTNEIEQIITVLRADNPRVIVLLAKIIPNRDLILNQRIIELNQQIDSIAVSKSTVESPVVIVDQNLGFNVTEDTDDGVHPNRTGAEKIAQKWFEATAKAAQLRYLPTKKLA
jgi:lysophospholipase L1-like esterase